MVARPPPKHKKHYVEITTQFHADGSLTFLNLTIYGHSAEQMSTLIQSYVRRRGSNLTLQQQQGLGQFKELEKLQTQLVESNELILKYFNAFNDIFFFGCLKSLCKVQFYPQEAMRPGLRGQCTYPQNGTCLIRIKSGSRKGPPKTRLTGYLSTLVHEMLHAVFHTYVCRCGHVCKNRYAESVGGHGIAWQWAALAIQESTMAILGIEKDYNLGRRCPSEDLEVDALNDWGALQAEVDAIQRSISPRTPDLPQKPTRL